MTERTKTIIIYQLIPTVPEPMSDRIPLTLKEQYDNWPPPTEEEEAEYSAAWAIWDSVYTCKVKIEKVQRLAPVNLKELEFQNTELQRLNGELQSLMMRLEDDGSSKPEPQAAPAAPAAATQPQAASVEAPEQRRARWLDWYGDGGRGAVQRVHERELLLNPKADRSYIGKQIKVARAERGEQDTKKSSGAWVAQLMTVGKRKG